jgi:hypothetical protein
VRQCSLIRFIFALFTLLHRHVSLLATSMQHVPSCETQSRTLTQLKFPLILHTTTTLSITIWAGSHLQR